MSFSQPISESFLRVSPSLFRGQKFYNLHLFAIYASERAVSTELYICVKAQMRGYFESTVEKSTVPWMVFSHSFSQSLAEIGIRRKVYFF